MKSITIDMKEIIEMNLSGVSYNEIVSSSAYSWLEFYFGVCGASSWYEYYIELSSIEEKKEMLKLPVM